MIYYNKQKIKKRYNKINQQRKAKIIHFNHKLKKERVIGLFKFDFFTEEEEKAFDFFYKLWKKAGKPPLPLDKVKDICRKWKNPNYYFIGNVGIFSINDFLRKIGIKETYVNIFSIDNYNILIDDGADIYIVKTF